MRKHPIAQMLSIGIVASIIGVAISLSIRWFPKSADTASHKIDTLYDVLLICSVPVFVLVMTVAIYSVVKFRAKPGDMSDGAPIHGNTRLEIVWVTIPFLMVTGLAIYGWVVLNNVEAKKPNERVINVVGQQFTWHFQYAKAGGTADPGPCGGSGPGQVTSQPARAAERPARLLPDLRQGRDPLVLGTRVPPEGGRGARHRHAHPAHAQPHRHLHGGVRGALRPGPLDDARARAGRARRPSSPPGSTPR